MKAKLVDAWIEVPFQANEATNTHTHALHGSPVVHASHVFPASPVSNLEQELKTLAILNACVAPNTARKKRFKLLRDLAAVEKSLGRQLTHHERMNTFDLWYSASKPYLDSKKTRDQYLTFFFAESGKVRMPTGEGDTLTKALEHLSTVPLPKLPGNCVWPESWRKVAALHRELARQSANGTYFLSCRDAAKADPTLNKDSAANINRALAQIGVIDLLQIGSCTKASEYRYLLPLDASDSPSEAFVTNRRPPSEPAVRG